MTTTIVREDGSVSVVGDQLDTFGRVRVSTPETLFDSKLIFDDAPLFWDEELESGASISSSHSVNEAAVTITSTLDTAGLFTRQTFRRFNYQPGKSQLIFMTFVLDDSGGGTGVERRVGLFDDDNGLFLYDDEGTYKLVRRTNVTGTPVDNEVAQSSWSLDPMDGTGPSGITLDFTKTQILVIDFEWLGVGRVRIGFNIDEVTYYVHEFLNANNLSDVYMSTPNLPLRFQLETQATSAASTLKCICCSVMSEGGKEDLGVVRYVSTAGTHVDANSDGTLYAVLGLRLKTTHLGASIKILQASIITDTNNDSFEWVLVFNPTVAGTFTYSDVDTESALQYATGATANTVTGGYAITGGHGFSDIASSSEISNALRLGAAIDGTRDEIVLCVRPVNSTNLDIEGGLTWRELL